MGSPSLHLLSVKEIVESFEGANCFAVYGGKNASRDTGDLGHSLGWADGRNTELAFVSVHSKGPKFGQPLDNNFLELVAAIYCLPL